MKKKYESPLAEVMEFDLKDIMMADSSTPKENENEDGND